MTQVDKDGKTIRVAHGMLGSLATRLAYQLVADSAAPPAVAQIADAQELPLPVTSLYTHLALLRSELRCNGLPSTAMPCMVVERAGVSCHTDGCCCAAWCRIMWTR